MWRTPVAQKSNEKNIKIERGRTTFFLKKSLKRAIFAFTVK